jgi:hypothetical protein
VHAVGRAAGLVAGDGERGVHLDDEPLAGRRDEVGLVDPGAVGLDTLDGGARVLGQGRGGGAGRVGTGEQVLVGPDALALVDGATRGGRIRGGRGARGRGRRRAVGRVGGRSGCHDSRAGDGADERDSGDALAEGGRGASHEISWGWAFSALPDQDVHRT